MTNSVYISANEQDIDAAGLSSNIKDWSITADWTMNNEGTAILAHSGGSVMIPMSSMAGGTLFRLKSDVGVYIALNGITAFEATDFIVAGGTNTISSVQVVNLDPLDDATVTYEIYGA